jgi:glyoxylase-like metal-dependent hydrolase (beta-lactamase superfamily II)
VLYVWVIEGGPRPIVVETGPNPLYVEEFNRSTAQYIPGGIQQTPEELTPVALKRAGIDPAEVSHVILTHAHGDHYDYFSAFPNAKFVMNRTEFEDHFDRFPPDVMQAIRARRGVLQLAIDGDDVVPGVTVHQLGCHTRGSQGVRVHTAMGPVLLTGDVVYMYDNIEQNRPGRSPDPGACLDAMTTLRALADIILPSHDPETLRRWPDGIIAAPPRIDPRAR